MIEHLLRIIDGYACGEEDTKRRQEIQAEYDKAVALRSPPPPCKLNR
jgi:hypothetical protein